MRASAWIPTGSSVPAWFTLYAVSLLVSILLCLEIGQRVGRRGRASEVAGAERGISALEGSVFGLFGLLLAFTFSGAVTRFEHRRALVLEEANAIGTAYLRIDLLPAEAQPALRGLFRQYVESRLTTYRLPQAAAYREFDHTVAIQGEIWRRATTAAQASPSPAALQLVGSSLNTMFDITTTRLAVTRAHPPLAIYVMLFSLGVTSALLAGYALSGGDSRYLLHKLAFAISIGTTVYVILDIEYPRLGVIRVDAADELLRMVLRAMR